MSGIVLAGDLGHIDIYEDNARSVEVVREEKDGKLGSFGFALVGVGPSRIGTVVPGKNNQLLHFIAWSVYCVVALSLSLPGHALFPFDDEHK